MKRRSVLLLACCLAGCSYVQTATKQAYYAAKQTGTPQQRIYKHMLDRDTFFVYGRLLHPEGKPDQRLAVIALSDTYQPGELVDINYSTRSDSYYALNLPVGNFRLLAVSDVNGDGFYDDSEVTGRRELSLDLEHAPEKVLGDFDIDLSADEFSSSTPFKVAVSDLVTQVDSVFYPKGTIRELSDPLFDKSMATLGLYEPAVFMEKAPMLFYALEEDQSYKIPVVFVHGIDGSPRDFEAILAKLDRTRYRPWFFYYPSGQRLGQVSEMFYRLFLSGKVIPLDELPMVIVAHSMGGVIVRDAMNRCTGKRGETKVLKLITIASPLGGHPGARSAKHAPVVIPSWRDMNPDSAFIHKLYRHSLSAGTEYHLFYTMGLDGKGDDGVVPLSSQLVSTAQDEAFKQFGIKASHAGVLSDPEAIDRIIQVIAQVHPVFPEDHLKELWKGGYTMALGKDYSPMETYFIRNIGYYMDALVEGHIQPFHPLQVHFIKACRGECAPTGPVETAWVKFNRDYPDRDKEREE